MACRLGVENGRLADLRVAVGSVGPRPMRAERAEELLAGLPADELDQGVLDDVGAAAAEATAPTADANGSPEYKAQLVRVLIERTLREALAAATAAG